jgi:hypothetical protein
LWHGFSADARRLAADNPVITMAGLCAAAMSKPWHPDQEIARARSGGGERLRPLDAFIPSGLLERLRQHRLPDGAKVGLALLAAACIGAAIGLYEVAGPSDVFERDPAIDWNAVDEAAGR